MLEVIKSRLINAWAVVEARLIDDWWQSYKFGSVWLHWIGTSSAFAYVYENPGALNNLLYGLPPQWRLPVFFTLGGIWFAFGWAVRIYKGKSNG